MKVLIAIPVYNEEKILKDNILKIFNFCQNNITDNWQIIIVDNQSTDQTAVIGQKLANQQPEIKYLFINQKGKGLAIKTAWQKYPADIYCFMDVDLATDLSALPQLINGIKEGNDLVVGSRFHSQSKVKRSFVRKLASNFYQLILKIILGLKIDDAPCGFKAINNKVKVRVLLQVKDEEWFFDSELVILAEKQGYKIKEIPVIWQEPRQQDDKSRVKIISLGLNYFKQVIRLKNKLIKSKTT